MPRTRQRISKSAGRKRDSQRAVFLFTLLGAVAVLLLALLMSGNTASLLRTQATGTRTPSPLVPVGYPAPDKLSCGRSQPVRTFTVQTYIQTATGRTPAAALANAKRRLANSIRAACTSQANNSEFTCLNDVTGQPATCKLCQPDPNTTSCTTTVQPPQAANPGWRTQRLAHIQPPTYEAVPLLEERNFDVICSQCTQQCVQKLSEPKDSDAGSCEAGAIRNYTVGPESGTVTRSHPTINGRIRWITAQEFDLMKDEMMREARQQAAAKLADKCSLLAQNITGSLGQACFGFGRDCTPGAGPATCQPANLPTDDPECRTDDGIVCLNVSAQLIRGVATVSAKDCTRQCQCRHDCRTVPPESPEVTPAPGDTLLPAEGSSSEPQRAQSATSLSAPATQPRPATATDYRAPRANDICQKAKIWGTLWLKVFGCV